MLPRAGLLRKLRPQSCPLLPLAFVLPSPGALSNARGRPALPFAHCVVAVLWSAALAWRSRRMQDWSTPLLLAPVAFLGALLWRVRPALGSRRRASREALREARQRIESAPDE